MLDFIEKNAENEEANKCMERFYSQTLDSFQSTNNERLWLKTNTKLARLWLDQKDYRRLTDKMRELHKACQKEDGTDDPSKGTYALEVYALEILMYAETRNNKRLKVSHVVDKIQDFHTKGYANKSSHSGVVSKGAESPFSCATSENHGHHTGMRRQDAHERRYVTTPEVRRGIVADGTQRIGRRPRVIFSSPSAVTTKPVLYKGYKYSNTWYSPPCSWGQTSTRSTHKRLSRIATTRALQQ